MNAYKEHNTNKENHGTLKRFDGIQNNNKKIWAKFTYFDNDIRIVTKIFKNSPIKIAYSTNNTIKNNCIVRDRKDKYSTCGMYELKCLTCDQFCVGQTSRNFKTRYEEHANCIRLNKDKSTYAVHILQ
jgi:hypothetical protein